jgi:hypothetical protein
MDDRIAKFMLLAAKFEFFLINHSYEFAHIDGRTGAVKGVNWDRVGSSLEGARPFSEFAFKESGFDIFKETVPMFLKLTRDSRFRWDSEEIEINSWETLLGRSYAQLRNNVAHGNKAQLAAPFRHKKTEEFLVAGEKLILFIAETFGGDYIVTNEIYFQ